MRALVLYLIGSVIIPSNNSVHLVTLNFLEDIDMIKDFEWGASMPALLQISLRKVKLEEATFEGKFLIFISKDMALFIYGYSIFLSYFMFQLIFHFLLRLFMLEHLPLLQSKSLMAPIVMPLLSIMFI